MIGLVDEHGDAWRQLVDERFDFFARCESAGGIVGIDDVNEPCGSAGLIQHHREVVLVAFVERNVHDFDGCSLSEPSERGKRGRGLQEFLARLQESECGHAENLAGAAAKDDLLALNIVQRGKLVDQSVVFRAWITIAAGGGFAQDCENLLGRAIRILVSIEKDGICCGSDAGRLSRRNEVLPLARCRPRKGKRAKYGGGSHDSTNAKVTKKISA